MNKSYDSHSVRVSDSDLTRLQNTDYNLDDTYVPVWERSEATMIDKQGMLDGIAKFCQVHGQPKQADNLRLCAKFVCRKIAETDFEWEDFPEAKMRSSSVFFKYIYNKIYYSVHPR